MASPTRFRLHVLLLLGALGASAVRAQEPLLTLGGEFTGDFFGASVAGAGDVDHDGIPDLLVGARHHGETQELTAGKVYLYSGDDGTLIRSWAGEERLDEMGVAVAGGGDVDNDGTLDALVGAWRHDGEAGDNTGKAYVYSGADGSLLRSWEGELVEDGFGFSLTIPGDFDGDGYDDAVVGSYLHDGLRGIDSGRVYIYSGADGALIHAQDGEESGDNLGWAVAPARDVNGDGLSDLLVGADQFDGEFGLDCGKAYVIGGPDGAELFTWDGEMDFAHHGGSVAGAGDLNGDLFPDVLVGAHLYSGPAGLWSGRVYAYSGFDGTLLWTQDGEGAFDRFGGAMADAGDVDGDGVGDVLIGAHLHDGEAGGDSGKIYVYSGDSAKLLASWEGEGEEDGFGVAVAGAGDVDTNGSSDILVGAWRHDGSSGPDSGRAYVYEGLVPSSILFDTSCMAECPASVFMVSISGVNSSGDDATVIVELAVPGPIELFAETVLPGAFEIAREFRFPADVPPSHRCPIELTLEARLETTDGDSFAAQSIVEAVVVSN